MDAARAAINKRNNASLVQCRVPLPLRVLLSRTARRGGISVSALVRAILIDHFEDTKRSISMAPKTRRA